VTDISGLRAGVLGTGFVGVVHVQALRLLGVDVGDGHRAKILGDAIAAANETRAWVQVPTTEVTP
jgi:hypothetical protein